MKLKLKRKQILDFLRKDARITFTEISKNNKYPITTVFDNYNYLIDKKIIKQHISILNYETLGYSHRFFFIFEIKNNAFLNELKNNKNLNSLTQLNNSRFLADLIFAKLSDTDDFLEQELLKNCFDVQKLNFISCIKFEETILS